VTVGYKTISNTQVTALAASASVAGWEYKGLASAYNTGSFQTGENAGLLTATHPYDKVYHVTQVDVDPAPSSTPSMFYWEADTSDAWAERLKASGAGLKVSYTNGATKNLTIKEAIDRGIVWWNDNPASNNGTIESEDTFRVFGVRTTTQPNNKAKLAYNKIAEPKIRINYRGARTELPVDIFTSLETINVVYKDEVDGTFTVDMKWDDNDIGGRDAAWYASKVNVEAVFTSFSSGETKTLPLLFDESKAGGLTAGSVTVTTNVSTGATEDYKWSVYTDGVPGIYWYDKDGNKKGSYVAVGTAMTGASPVPKDTTGALGYYSMDFGKPAWPTASAVNGSESGWSTDWTSGGSPAYTTIAEVARTKYGVAAGKATSAGILNTNTAAFGQCNTIKNNDKEKAVTFYYSPPPSPVETDATYGTLQVAGNVKTKAVKNTLTVYWTNIHKK